MESFRGNTNGERDGRRTPEENQATAMAYRRVPSQSQQQPCHQPLPENQRALDEQVFGYQSGVDLETLESSFGSLSVLDSSVRPQQNPFLDNRWSNRSSLSLHNQGITNGGGSGYYSPPPLPPPTVNREIDSLQQMVMNQYSQRVSYQNDCVNGGSYGYDANGSVMVNNGYNSRDVPYLPRNRFVNQSPLDQYHNNGFESGINSSWRNNNGGFVSNHDQYLSMDNSRCPIAWLAKDRNGSARLQGDIDSGSKEKLDRIFNDVIFQICDLMVDPFGHHVTQKLMDKCSSQQITQILDKVTQQQYRFLTICNDPLGTRAVQSLMRSLHSEEQISRMVGAISMVAMLLTRSNNAKHVILQCFNQFSPSQNMNLLEVIAQNCYQIAIDQNGCCMLQQCLGIGCNMLKQRLIHEIIANALRLCLNCYGNYVVQYVVELEDPSVTLDLVRQLDGNYAYLSRNKYGSHAVQKLLKIKYIDSSFIINDLLRDIDTLLLDPFGNYVIQTAFLVSKDNVRDLLKWHIERNKRLMRCNKFGTKILEKFNL